MGSAGARKSGGLVIFGGWYLGRAAAEAAELVGWTVAGFVDPEPMQHVTALQAVPHDASVFVAIGDNAMRGFVCERLADHGRRLVSILHPTCVVSPSATIGAGCFLSENAVVRSHSTVGRGAILSAGSVVSHDCRVGDFVTLGPNAATAGHVMIGDRTTLGVGASVRPHVSIGRDCDVGAGSGVMRDLADGQAAIGVPARTVPRAAGTGRQSNWKENPVW
ncbi:acetyltransferase [Mesorhizobium sp. 10J20-29]